MTIRNSVIMGADYYETPAQLAADRSAGPAADRHRRRRGDRKRHRRQELSRRRGAQVIGDPQQIERIAGENWEMLDGIIVVPKNAVLPDGWRRR